MVIDRQGRFIFANAAAARSLGYSREGFAKLRLWDVSVRETRADFRRHFAHIQEGRTQHFEARHRRKDGSVLQVAVSSQPFSLRGEPVTIAIWRDITATNRAHEALRLHHEITTSLSESIQLFRAEDRRIVYANPKSEELFGYGPGELAGKDVASLSAPCEGPPERVYQEIFKQLGAGDSWQGEVRHIRKDKSLFWAFANVSEFHHHEHGRVFLAVESDITRRKSAEEALRRSEAILAEAESLAGIGSVDRDLATGKVSRSHGIAQIFGVDPSEMTDDPEDFLRHLREEDRDRVRSALRRSVAEDLPFREEYRVVRPDGRTRLVHAEGKVIRDERGSPVRFFAWLQDITERRELEKKVLRISDRERRSIGQDLHDDLGQQITGISLLGRALQRRLAAEDSPESETMTDILQHVDRALTHVRTLARGLQSVPARPEGLMEALTGLAAHARATSGIPCRFQARRPVAVQDPALANHLFRIAQESVANALRHARPRKVTIRLDRAGRGLVLSVADDGAGLPKQERDHGGMGLDIMRHRANLIHAVLAVRSSPGRGTTVTCRVPETGPGSGGQP